MGSSKPKKTKKSKAKKEAEQMADMGSDKNSQPQTKQQQPAPAQNTGSIDLFGDIFGGGSAPTTTNTNNPVPNNNNDIFSLLGNMGSSNTNNANNNQGGLMDLNSMLNSNNQQPQQSSGGGMIDLMNMGGQASQNNTPQNLKEVFRNGDISIFSSLNQNNNVYNGSFYISNNTNSQINDVVVNFLVKKYISCQVLSTSGKDLAPNASLGIKKDVTMTNKDPNKAVIIKMSINYSKDGNNVTESKVVNL